MSRKRGALMRRARHAVARQPVAGAKRLDARAQLALLAPQPVGIAFVLASSARKRFTKAETEVSCSAAFMRARR